MDIGEKAERSEETNKVRNLELKLAIEEKKRLIMEAKRERERERERKREVGRVKLEVDL